ncbi:MAG: 2-dehydro-3-deoxygalactonokinase, partial [Burkholderiaceae bacterium]
MSKMASHENAEVYVDWGSTGFRACRFGPEGPQWHRNPEGGLLHVDQGNFESALRREIGAWLVPGVTVWLAGMVTSRNGWVETPYVPVPARLEDLARATVERRIDDRVTLRFVPGISQREPSPDVMRGEEAQVFGAVGAQGSGLVVLPGTHSKWV